MWTNEDHAVAAAHNVDPARWQEAFEGLMGRIAARYARVEPRLRRPTARTGCGSYAHTLSR
ncbi:hypothetical protein FH610_035265 [Microbispora catharanthi]|uniref:Uncharacterized protein n=1 Tax=Microbispora catharanthi TaxID=1712871 RepID=A0A5N6BE27_9ACTN|nr:hypothetical protein FH610_035265 [Microbispora catharanthi]